MHRRCHCRADRPWLQGSDKQRTKGQSCTLLGLPHKLLRHPGSPAPSFGTEAVRGWASSRLVSGEADSAWKGSNSTPIGDMKYLPTSYRDSRQFLCRTEALPFLPGEMPGHVWKSHCTEQGMEGELHGAGKRTKRWSTSNSSKSAV